MTVYWQCLLLCLVFLQFLNFWYILFFLILLHFSFSPLGNIFSSFFFYSFPFLFPLEFLLLFPHPCIPTISRSTFSSYFPTPFIFFLLFSRPFWFCDSIFMSLPFTRSSCASFSLLTLTSSVDSGVPGITSQVVPKRSPALSFAKLTSKQF